MIQVIKPGLYSSIQDLGRFGHREKGVPVCGVMDSISAKLVNTLLGNEAEDAVLEISLTGPELLFEEATFIAISGAIISPMLNDKEIYNDEVYKINAGDVLKFGKLKSGVRCYLAVLGGFQTTVVLGSRSWYVSITKHFQLKKGMFLPIEKHQEYEEKKGIPVLDHNFKQRKLMVYKGPEFDLLSEKQRYQLMNGIFNIAKENNRMAYQLKQQLYKHSYSILTSATIPGTVQLTPSGKLIVLMRDAQTTGGYPRILQLTEEAISLLSQKNTDEDILFDLVE